MKRFRLSLESLLCAQSFSYAVQTCNNLDRLSCPPLVPLARSNTPSRSRPARMACPLPIVDLDAFRASSDSLEARNEAVRARPPPPQSSPTSRVDPRLSLTQAAEALIEYGALIAKDSRVSEQENERFLDLLEEYFAQDEQDLRKDLRPEVHFQGAQGIPLHVAMRPTDPGLSQSA